LGIIGELTIAHFEANVVPVEGCWRRREHDDGGGVEVSVNWGSGDLRGENEVK
jgi:hypothetical protein